MFKIKGSLIILINIIKNVYQLGLWKAFFRKIYNIRKKNLLSEEAKLFYQNTKISINEAMKILNISSHNFSWTPRQETILALRNKKLRENNYQKTSQSLKQIMGGIANVKFLYSLVISKKKINCIECGVSMGGSSVAILKGLQKNNEGVLFSNDLPYLWIENPLKKIGILIDEKLKEKWFLTIGDDKDNLTSMLNQIKTIDLAYYDSNKLYENRVYFFKSIYPFMNDKCTVIFDDIIDNDHFYDLSKSLKKEEWISLIVDDNDKIFGVLQKS